MDFYYRSLSEGGCEVVCTRCFLTVGAGLTIKDVQRIERSHMCLVKGLSVATNPLAVPMPQPPDRSARIQANFHTVIPTQGRSMAPVARNAFVLLAATLFLYLLPTASELVALRNWNPWIASVLPGDFVGCAFLCIAFRKVKAGIFLYCLLTGFEACACSLHIISLSVLPWFTDSVPTMIASALVLRSSGQSAKLFNIS